MGSRRPRRSSFERSLRAESRAASEGDVGAGVTSLAALRSRGPAWPGFHLAPRRLSGREVAAVRGGGGFFAS
jgi:hypothetical protein